MLCFEWEHCELWLPVGVPKLGDGLNPNQTDTFIEFTVYCKTCHLKNRGNCCSKEKDWAAEFHGLSFIPDMKENLELHEVRLPSLPQRELYQPRHANWGPLLDRALHASPVAVWARWSSLSLG